MDNLELAIKKMVIKQCRVKGVQPEQLPSTEPVIGSQGAMQLDSLDAVEIVTCLERSFGLKAEGMPLKNIFRSYSELTTYVSQNATEEKLKEFIQEYQ